MPALLSEKTMEVGACKIVQQIVLEQPMTRSLESVAYHEAGHAVTAIASGGEVSKILMKIDPKDGEWASDAEFSLSAVRQAPPVHIPMIGDGTDHAQFEISLQANSAAAQAAIGLSGFLAQVAHAFASESFPLPDLTDGESLVSLGRQLSDTSGNEIPVGMDFVIDGEIVRREYLHSWCSARDRRAVRKALQETSAPHDERCAFLILVIWHQLQSDAGWARVERVAAAIIQRQQEPPFEVDGDVVHHACQA